MLLVSKNQKGALFHTSFWVSRCPGVNAQIKTQFFMFLSLFFNGFFKNQTPPVLPRVASPTYLHRPYKSRKKLTQIHPASTAPFSFSLQTSGFRLDAFTHTFTLSPRLHAQSTGTDIHAAIGDADVRTIGVHTARISR